MRRLYLTLAIYCSILVGSVAQEITISTDTLKEISNRNYKYQSFDQYDQRLLLKLGTPGGFVYSVGSGFRDLPFDFFAVEYRLTKRISLEGTYFFPISEFSSISLKLRQYLKRGRLADNFSGKYFALEYTNRFRNTESFEQALFFQFGNQIKKSRFGYADFNMFSSYRFSSFGNSLNLGLNVVVGAAWGPLGKRAAIDSNTESEFSSHREHFLITIENPTFTIGERFQSYSISSTVEKELFIKGLTVRTRIGGGFSRQNNLEGFKGRTFGFSVNAGMRKYLGLFKRPHADDPIHSFAGMYLGAGFNELFSHVEVNLQDINGTTEESRSGYDRASPFVALGYQERIGKRYFFDIFARYSFYTFRNFWRNNKGPAFLSFGTRVGVNWGK